jgi:phospholipase C
MTSATGQRTTCVASMTIALLALCGCQGITGNGSGTSGTTNPNGSLQNSVNHIIFMSQENRSLDTYFGQLPAYWAANGYPAQQFDGLPSGASNPAYNGTTTPGSATINAYHLTTECFENLSPSWNESHEDWNLQTPTSTTPLNNGFVYNAAAFSIDSGGPSAGFYDTTGLRAMGYYDWTDLPFYYFMASNFATSDRWFSPALDRTQINRLYMFAATSHGYAYEPGFDANDQGAVPVNTIFDSLSAAGISWKIYATDMDCGSDGNGPCTYLSQFAKYSTSLPSNVVAATDFLQDANSGTLPSVAFIEGGYNSAQDEHPDNNVQVGANYVASLITGFMKSESWKDSIFILTYDEGGGVYDHVPPQAAVNPDGIAPVDLLPTDICASTPNVGPNCDFNVTGFRVPLIVISPFTIKNYVSHTVADYTAILKLIETRFGLQPLTKRDAAQPDMTEFFDFQNVPWATPPSNVPAQPTNGNCNFQQLGYPGS